jgi:apolipoprotein N-acyltransferase
VAWLGGLLFYTPALSWMRLADPRMYATWLVLSLHCSVFFMVGILLVRWLDRRTRLPLVVTLPVVWTVIEFARANCFGGFATYLLGHAQHDLPGGFAWYFLAHTQHEFLPLIQIADLGGAYGVTFLVAAVNALVFELLYSRPWFRDRLALPNEAPRFPRLTIQATAVLVLVGGALAYGVWRLSEEGFKPGPRVALIQGNLDQRIRNMKATNRDVGDLMLEHYGQLSDDAVRQQPRPDLIVWPETSYPDDWAEIGPDFAPADVPPQWRRYLRECASLPRQAARRWGTNVLLGLNTEVLRPGKNDRYNSVVLMTADGQVGGLYHKVHRVPFGEYVPLRETFPWLNTFAPYDYDYSIRPGEQFTRFPLGEYSFGVIICYEDTDPYLARQYVNPASEARAVDFLVNVSNDGWFDGSSEHEEHLAICRFRAVECRRAVARAVNMGISAVIDGSGRVIALPAASWAESKKIAAVVTAVVPIDRRASLYVRWGDWLPASCGGLLGLGLIVTLVWNRPSRDLQKEGRCTVP